MFANKYGLNALLKEGGRVFSGVDEVVLKNIEACRALTSITKTSLGPNSMNKLVVNHIGKRYVTSDAAVIASELDLQHPAAKLLVQSAKMQEAEFGDATNFVLVFAGELLNQAEALIKVGLHTADIIKGYELAVSKCLEYLSGFSCWKIESVTNVHEISRAIKTVIGSKQASKEAKIVPLVAEAVAMAMPPNPLDFNTENIRVTPLMGGSLDMSYLINGMVILRDTEGVVKKKHRVKVVVYNCGLEMTGTEATSTVLLKNSEELLEFTKSEERHMEAFVKGVKDTGVEAMIVNGSVSDIAQHFCNKYDILVLRVPSKHELRRVCRSLQAIPLVRLGAPVPEEIGMAQEIEVEEISSKKVTIIRSADSIISSIVLRGATKNVLDELERAIDDAVSCVKAFIEKSEFLPGAGACEMYLANLLQDYGATVPGLDQYAVLKFATALECIPGIIAENAGYNKTDIISKLYAAHQQGNETMGVNIWGPSEIVDAKAEDILDHKETKTWAIRLAVDTVLTILRIDQILVAKPAGGPAPREPGPPDLD